MLQLLVFNCYVLDYGKRLLEFGAFYLELCDAIREGDGDYSKVPREETILLKS